MNVLGAGEGSRPAQILGVALPGRALAWDLSINGGQITAIIRSRRGPPSQIALPAFHEPHLHADRAYQRPSQRPESFAEAVELATALRGRRAAAIAKAARHLFTRASSHGVIFARTHVDTDAIGELVPLRGVLEAAGELTDRMHVEIVAFATRAGDPAETRSQRRLAAALTEGATVLGGVPVGWADPLLSTGKLFELASKHQVGVDLHIDETTRAGDALLPGVTALALDAGMHSRIAFSHCSVLPHLDASARNRVIESLAELDAVVNVQPAVSLYLQDVNGGRTPLLRGVTLVRELLAAGVKVQFGSDNVQDAFFPYGDADPLDAAYLAALATGVRDDLALLAGVTGGRPLIDVGSRADIVLVAAHDLVDALARRPAARTVMRGGVVVAGSAAARAAPGTADPPGPQPGALPG